MRRAGLALATVLVAASCSSSGRPASTPPPATVAAPDAASPPTSLPPPTTTRPPVTTTGATLPAGPGTTAVDATVSSAAPRLGSVTSWDGALTAAHPLGVSGWAFAGVADGVLAGAEDLGPDFPERRPVARFLEALGGGRDMDTPGLLVVFVPVGGDLDAAGRAAIGAPLPSGCDGPDVEPVTRSGLAGAEALGACGDASFRHGYVAAPGAGGIVEYWTFYLDDEDAGVGDAMLDSLAIGDPAAEPTTRVVHVWPADQGRDEIDGAAVIGLAAGVADVPSAWLGPWNSGTVEFASRDGRSYRIVWASPELAPLDVPAGGAARIALPPDGDRHAYTVMGDGVRSPGVVRTYEPAAAEIVEFDTSRDSGIEPLLRVEVPTVDGSWTIDAAWPWLLSYGVPLTDDGGTVDVAGPLTVAGPAFTANLIGLGEEVSASRLRDDAASLAGQLDAPGCRPGDPEDATVAGWPAVTYLLDCEGELTAVSLSLAWPDDPSTVMLLVVTGAADDEDRWFVAEALRTLDVDEDALADFGSQDG